MKGQTKRRYSAAELATVIVFLAFIGIFFVLILVMPKAVGELSGNERRMKADYPLQGSDFSDGTFGRELFNGTLSNNVDSFLEDHFPARSFFVALDSYSARLMGRNSTQSVTWGRNDRLFAAATAADYERIDWNLDRFLSFAEDNGLSATVAVIPSSASIIEEELPPIHAEYLDEEMIAHIVSRAEESGAYSPNIFTIFSKEDDRGGLYYRTDHHWTMDGAYLFYTELCSELDLEAVSEDEFTKTAYEFYGTSYGSAGLWLVEPDDLYIWEHPDYERITVTVGIGDTAVTHTGVFDYDKLEEGYTDKYASYLYSNNGVTVIENPNGNGRSVMIVKDSFANSVTPVFALNYSRVIMIDTRYYSSALPTPGELVEQYGITELMLIFGLDNIAADSGIAWLR